MKELMKKTLIVFIVFSLLLTIYYIYYGVTEGFARMELYINGLQLIGLLTIFVGILALIGDLGGFDLVGYSFVYISESRYKTKDRKYQNYKDYMDKKAVERKKKLPSLIAYAIVGGIYIIVSLILSIWA